ncbi:MAG: ISNCY family transposase [Alphaproteobacteria bacterium]|nr:ISNCY family transposase [Alphaproteobacteria bacterium]
MLWEVFVIRFEEALERYQRRRLKGEEAGELLGMSGRNFRRLCERYEEEGVEGQRDRRLGKPSPRRAPADELERMRRLYVERYHDLTVKHFHEQMERRHGYQLCYTVTRLDLQAAGLVKPAVRRSCHRKKRVRRPVPGMLVFQDGSTHRWIPEPDRALELIVTLDDATGAIHSAFLAEQEGTLPSFLGLGETIAGQGLFGALYTDRGSHYFHTPKAGGAVNKKRLTQVGRVLAQLGITHIPSYSPEARGRIERAFGTLQMRLPPELRLAGIAGVAAANRYLREHFIPDHNQRFAVAAAAPGNAFVPYVGRPLEEVLCIQEDRQAGRDNCVVWRGRSWQIPAQPHRHHYVKATVRVHEYPDGRLALFDGPRCLARYDATGGLLDDQSRAA